MANENRKTFYHLLADRFDDAPKPSGRPLEQEPLHRMAARGSCRSFRAQPVPSNWIEAVCATALAAPTKSDLQQRDIIILESDLSRKALAELVPGQQWVTGAPAIAVFCGNNRRQRLIHEHHGILFANDHLDALFNAIGDAAIALGAFVTAAEAIGLGCCPISAVRNEAAKVSKLLRLPDHVFPFAGLAFGFPSQPPTISKRLPLNMTCHVDTYQERDLIKQIEAYDDLRAQTQPYSSQRFPEKFAPSTRYSWSEDKARQYSEPEREDFGRFIRSVGFKLD